MTTSFPYFKKSFNDFLNFLTSIQSTDPTFPASLSSQTPLTQSTSISWTTNFIPLCHTMFSLTGMVYSPLLPKTTRPSSSGPGWDIIKLSITVHLYLSYWIMITSMQLGCKVIIVSELLAQSRYNTTKTFVEWMNFSSTAGFIFFSHFKHDKKHTCMKYFSFLGSV